MTRIASITEPKEKPKQVVRLVTSFWKDNGGGINIKRTLRPMRKLSRGFQYLENDCDMVGAEDLFGMIVNLDQCKDGVYLVDTCNISTDWETGIVDDYDYKLVPFEEEQK